jgi:glycosyltransferase involved in cell wall biosynthesis
LPALEAGPPPHPSVCFVTGEYPPATGGVADYTALLAAHLQARGCRVAVVTSASGEPVAQWSGDADPVHVVRIRGWGPAAAARIARVVRAVDADLVHIQYQAAAYGTYSVLNILPLLLHARGIRQPVITTFHDLRVPYLFPKAGPLRWLAVQALIGASAGSIFTEPADLSRAHPLRRAVWIPMASTLAPSLTGSREATRAALGFADDEKVLAHFGFINASKGVDTLLRAAERLQRSGLEFRLLFVGEPHGASDATNVAASRDADRLAAQLGIDQRIVRTGRLDASDASAALEAADLAVHPYNDGASLRRSSLLACFAHGLPVVTTRPAAPRPLAATHTIPPFEDATQFRIDDRNAALVSPGDDVALARVTYRLLDDPARMEQLSAAGATLAQRLAWPAVASATEAFYRRTLGWETAAVVLSAPRD